MCFSVIISVFAEENPGYFQEAFESIWDAQTLKPGQIVLVKDGPLPRALEDVTNFWTEKLGHVLTTIALPENVGLGAALNIGLPHCDYELVARMDSDDISLPRRFEKQVIFMRNHLSTTILGTAAIEIDEDGICIGQRVYPTQHKELVEKLWTCPLIHPSLMFRKSFVEKIGGYSVSLPRRQDYELWFRACDHGARFANLDIPLIKYRFQKSTHGRQRPRDVWKFAVIGYRGSRRIGLPLWKAVGCFYPFFKSLLPVRAQHAISRIMRFTDPRYRTKNL